MGNCKSNTSSAIASSDDIPIDPELRDKVISNHVVCCNALGIMQCFVVMNCSVLITSSMLMILNEGGI